MKPDFVSPATRSHALIFSDRVYRMVAGGLPG